MNQRIGLLSLFTVVAASGAILAHAQQAGETPEQQLVIPLAPFSPGPGKPVWKRPPQVQDYTNNPEMIAAGKQLYAAMNCVGCHFHGGGGIGPPLMDTTWVYGSSIEHIFSTIREGRPNGMPSFRGRIPDEQIWQVAAYVKSLGGNQAN